MSHKFKAEDFFDAIGSIGAIGAFDQDLSDYIIRNSDEYKEACVHLHKDMQEQKHLVADMDTLPPSKEVRPFKLDDNEVLIALQSEKTQQKRMLSVTRYTPEEGGGDQMIIVPLLTGNKPNYWQPAGIVIFLKNLDDADKMQIHSQVFPGANVGQDKANQLTSIILDAMNIIVTAMATCKATMTEKIPSKFKVDRMPDNVELEPFTLMSIK
jgi:hypothetical protein